MARSNGDALIGIGVAIVGVVRRSDGFVAMAPNLGWRDVPLRRPLARALERDRPDLDRQRGRPGRPGRAAPRRGRRCRRRPVPVRRGRRRWRAHRRRPAADRASPGSAARSATCRSTRPARRVAADPSAAGRRRSARKRCCGWPATRREVAGARSTPSCDEAACGLDRRARRLRPGRPLARRRPGRPGQRAQSAADRPGRPVRPDPSIRQRRARGGARPPGAARDRGRSSGSCRRASASTPRCSAPPSWPSSRSWPIRRGFAARRRGQLRALSMALDRLASAADRSQDVHGHHQRSTSRARHSGLQTASRPATASGGSAVGGW